jgi:hypothetical protein
LKLHHPTSLTRPCSSTPVEIVWKSREPVSIVAGRRPTDGTCARDVGPRIANERVVHGGNSVLRRNERLRSGLVSSNIVRCRMGIEVVVKVVSTEFVALPVRDAVCEST